MDTTTILTSIDAEVKALQRARQAIASITEAPTRNKRAYRMSASARKRISQAQKARWAKQKRLQ